MSSFLDKFKTDKISTETAQQYIKHGLTAGVIMLILSAGLALFVEPFVWADVILLGILVFGLYKKSYYSAVILFIYFLVSKLLQFSEGGFVESGEVNSLQVFVSLIFLYYFFQAIIGTLKLKKGQQVKKRHHAVDIVLGLFIGVIITFVLLVLIGLATEYTSNTIFQTPEDQTNVQASVVNIFCPFVDEEFSIDANGTGGSGVVLNAEGTILSNQHILPQSETEYLVSDEGCFVIFPNPKTGSPEEIYMATPYVYEGISEEYDLAYLIIDKPYVDIDGVVYGIENKQFSSLFDLNACSIEALNLGDPVFIYGYPTLSGGINLTLTEGVISSFSNGYILTSAQISEGNSGGLALTKNQCMIGVPSIYLSEATHSFGGIISIDLIYEFLDKIEEAE